MTRSSIVESEGYGDIVLFNEEGGIVDVTHLGDRQLEDKFYHKLADPIFHTLVVRSEFLIFHEVTNGPFRSSNTVFPSWAPKEADDSEIKVFMSSLDKTIEEYLAASKGRERG